MFDLASRDSVAKIRKVGRKTKEILSFFAEMEQLLHFDTFHEQKKGVTSLPATPFYESIPYRNQMGNVSTKRAPGPSKAVSSTTSPPKRRAILRATVRPMPCPPKNWLSLT